jgi:hypothetical protein
MASLRATATTALLCPRRLTMFIPHAQSRPLLAEGIALRLLPCGGQSALPDLRSRSFCRVVLRPDGFVLAAPAVHRGVYLVELGQLEAVGQSLGQRRLGSSETLGTPLAGIREATGQGGALSSPRRLAGPYGLLRHDDRPHRRSHRGKGLLTNGNPLLGPVF